MYEDEAELLGKVILNTALLRIDSKIGGLLYMSFIINFIILHTFLVYWSRGNLCLLGVEGKNGSI